MEDDGRAGSSRGPGYAAVRTAGPAKRIRTDKIWNAFSRPSFMIASGIRDLRRGRPPIRPGAASAESRRRHYQLAGGKSKPRISPAKSRPGKVFRKALPGTGPSAGAEKLLTCRRFSAIIHNHS